MRAFAALLVLCSFGLSPVHAPASRPVIVHGTIRDANSAQPIEGVSVGIVSSASGVSPSTANTLSDASGRYALRVDLDAMVSTITIRARRIGYEPMMRNVTLRGDSVVADFALTQAVMALEGVVVTAIGGSSSQRSLGSHVAGLTIASSGVPVTLRGPTTKPGRDPRFNTEEYARIQDNDFLSVDAAPLSTFSADVDRASYTNVRRFIRSGQLPPKDAVRIEELVNYFPYAYSQPTERDPIAINTAVAPAPWNPNHRIVRVGLQTTHIETEKLPPSNLVFLIDVSGSMDEPQKLPLVKQAFRLLVNELREQDRVAIVVYAGAAGLVLPSTSAARKDVILDAIENLQAGGSTAGGAGIRLAYDVAKENFRSDGNNRVILATDGDFNIGISSTSELVRFVEERRADGIYLTVLGFGMGNLKDQRMEQLADKGNGNYAYIDDLMEARKTFVGEMGATLVTVAKDVKLQVEFNPAAVQAYRLIGYENRLLAKEDFDDDRKDAGEMGAGHSVTALYEIVPSGVRLDVRVQSAAPMRYQRQPSRSHASRTDELLFVNVRYKQPSDSTSRLMQVTVRDRDAMPNGDFRFALAVAGYGMLLRDSPHRGRWTYDDVLETASSAVGDDRDGYRREFVEMVKVTKELAGRVASRSR